MLSFRILSFAAMLRVGLYVFLHFSMGIAVSGSGLIGKRGGDTASYFDSIEHLLLDGHYTYSLSHLSAYAGRMPGYGVVYGFLRLWLPQNAACDGIVLLQMVLAIVSLYYLGNLAYIVTKRQLVAYAVVFISAVSPYVAQADLYLLTESFAASALLIGSYYFLRGISATSQRHLLIAGAWLTWVVFLRPYMAPLLVVLPAIYLYQHASQDRNLSKRIWLGGLLFLVPFVVVDGAWTIRNWVVCQQFIPLQAPYAGVEVSPVYLESRRFAAALGEDPVQWNTSSIMAWLTLPQPPAQAAPKHWQLTRSATYDSLVWVRQRIQAAKAEELLPEEQQPNTKQAVAALRRFHDAWVRERPFAYYVVAPLRLTYHLALTGGGTSIFAWPFDELALWQRGIRLLFTFSHWLLIGASLLSYLSWPRKLSSGWLVVRLPPIYLVVLFVLGLRYVESRYFIVVYPLALLSGLAWLVQVKDSLAFRFRFRSKVHTDDQSHPAN
ncbi:glycosyltransferase family 39 protein [uncultured Hymenobacter sp.]|uniref:glycosyltransferase family 39 protein n=1 Tax=uncultured Hymenobacter sp. TaxID=170016 RepID=UPI0035CB0EC1